ncbi:MAG: hypothetical protein DRN96_05025 [Thermoproteota archaeon]|nr:MAG: hypothetical protein DRN96_05025 [Candidatus Korarchaeota archaeon]
MEALLKAVEFKVTAPIQQRSLSSHAERGSIRSTGKRLTVLKSNSRARSQIATADSTNPVKKQGFMLPSNNLILP